MNRGCNKSHGAAPDAFLDNQFFHTGKISRKGFFVAVNEDVGQMKDPHFFGHVFIYH